VKIPVLDGSGRFCDFFLWLIVNPSARPSMSASRMIRAATLQKKFLRLRPMNANQCGSHLSENVRFTLPVSTPAVSAAVSFEVVGGVLEVELEVVKGLSLERMSFFGAGASHSGVSWTLVSVAIEGVRGEDGDS